MFLKDEFGKLLFDIKDSWENLGGDDIIDSFEKKWCEWDVDDTKKWFEFVLNCKGLKIDEKDDDEYDDDYQIEDYSSSDSSDDDDEQDEKKQDTSQIDFNDVKSRLIMMNFKAKREFPLLLKPFQFEKFGFKNKQDCKLLCKKTKILMKKYPRKKGKNTKKQNNKCQDGLEGFVQDTNLSEV